MFDWIRTKVKNAVLMGMADAAAVLEARGGANLDDAERLLDERLRLTAPEPEKKKARAT